MKKKHGALVASAAAILVVCNASSASSAFLAPGTTSVNHRRFPNLQSADVATASSPSNNNDHSHNPRKNYYKLHAAPRRLEENVPGPLYVNEKCINCAACSQFAPSVFSRGSSPLMDAHVVHHQPSTPDEIVEARAALSACPVAAIRTETNAQRSHRGDTERFSTSEEELANQLAINPKFNGRPAPFPLRVSDTIEGVYFVGHHSEKTFGAVPYLLETKEHGWILIDTPKYSKSAVQAIEELTGPNKGPSYMVLTHVDDTTGHNQWKEHYPDLKRIFHSGDLGRHNWLGDETLGEVEILLEDRSTNERLQFFDLQGNPISITTTTTTTMPEVVLIHTPGHSPGSICLWMPPSDDANAAGVIFTGDTYAFTTRDGGRMTSFPRYGNDRVQQSQILPLLVDLDWALVAPGHGHVREYSTTTTTTKEQRLADMEPAIAELKEWPSRISSSI